MTSFLLGILTVFVVWSFLWVLDARRQTTFEMPGDVTIVQMYGGPQSVAAADLMAIQRELMAYLDDQQLALTISSLGSGRPEMVVYDPHGLFSWFPRITPTDPSPSGVYLFEGTYSSRRWLESAATPLFPGGVVVEGVIAPPTGAGTLQYARGIDPDPPPPGQCTINSIDPTQVQDILSFLMRMGLGIAWTRPVPLVEDLILDPLFLSTVLLLVAGHACAVLYWFLYLRGRAPEFGVRSRHGAGPWDLVREILRGAVPGLVAGGLAGVVTSNLLLTAISGARLTPGNLPALASCGLIAVVTATTSWSAVVYAAVRLRYGVNLDA